MTTSVLIYGPPSGQTVRLEQLILGMAQFDLAGRASPERPAVDVVDELSPDILLLGSQPIRTMLNALAWIRAERSPVRVVICAPEMSRDETIEAMTLNVDGLFPDSASDIEILSCLEAVAEGGQWLAPLVRDIAAGRVTWDGRFVRDPFDVLTAREIEVAMVVAQVPSNPQAAEELGIKLHTLKMHLHRIYARLRVADRHELAQLAARRPVQGLNSEGPP